MKIVYLVFLLLICVELLDLVLSGLGFLKWGILFRLIILYLKYFRLKMAYHGKMKPQVVGLVILGFTCQ